MTTYLDYSGRTVDVAAFRGQRETGEALLDQTLVDQESGGEVCTGAQMTAQAWLLQFMREQGSAPYGEDGCGFLTALKRGRMLTELDVFQQFNLAAAKIRSTMVAAETAADPLDERFAAARLDRATIAPGSLTLYVTVTTLAGDARPVILPIPFSP